MGLSRTVSKINGHSGRKSHNFLIPRVFNAPQREFPGNFVTDGGKSLTMSIRPSLDSTRVCDRTDNFANTSRTVHAQDAELLTCDKTLKYDSCLSTKTPKFQPRRLLKWYLSALKYYQEYNQVCIFSNFPPHTRLWYHSTVHAQ